MKNVFIQENNKRLSLIDEQDNILFSHISWSRIKEFVYSRDLEIHYTPKDLIFDVSNGVNGYFVLFNTKYGNAELGSHNLSGLPSYYDNEECENTYLYNSNMLADQVITDLEALGAKKEDLM